MSDSAILVEGLAERFGDVVALDGIDFKVPAGTVFGLLGPNGAGKTTAIRILTTILPPDRGRAEVLGLDVVRQADEVRQRIGLAGQYAAVDPNLTGGRTCGRPARALRAGELLGERLATQPERDGATLRLATDDGSRLLIDALRLLDDHQLAPATLAVREPSMDDVFLVLTGHRAESGAGSAGSGQAGRRARRRGAAWVFATVGLAVGDPETAQAAAFPVMAPLVFASSAFVPVAVRRYRRTV